MGYAGFPYYWLGIVNMAPGRDLVLGYIDPSGKEHYEAFLGSFLAGNYTNIPIEFNQKHTP